MTVSTGSRGAGRARGPGPGGARGARLRSGGSGRCPGREGAVAPPTLGARFERLSPLQVIFFTTLTYPAL